jgi:hypothetical protein
VKLTFSTSALTSPARQSAGKSNATSFSQQIYKNLAKTQAKPEPNQNSLLKQQNTINSKLQLGKKLSKTEMEFLKKNSPTAYRNAKRAEQSRKQFEREVRACRTKEEVAAVRMRWHQMIATELQSIDQSNMDSSQKMEARMSAAMMLAAVEDAHREFQQSAAFQRLPDDDNDEKKRAKSAKEPDKDGPTLETSALLKTKEEASPGNAAEESATAAATEKSPATAKTTPYTAMQFHDTRPVQSENSLFVDVYI